MVEAGIHLTQLKNNMIKVIFGFILFCSLSLLFFGGLLTFWLQYPYEPLVIEKIEIVSTPKIGEEFVYKIYYTKKMNLPAKVIRQLVDDNVTTIPSIDSNVPVTTGDYSIGSFIMPKMISDRYKFRWTAIYQVNPLRTISVMAETKCFKLD